MVSKKRAPKPPPKVIWVVTYQDGHVSGATSIKSEAREWLANETAEQGPFKYVLSPKRKRRISDDVRDVRR